MTALSTLTGKVSEDLGRQRKRKEELADVFEKALREEQVRNTLDPTRASQVEAREEIERQAAQGGNRLDLLQKYGLLGRSGAPFDMGAYVFDPNQGQYFDTQGNPVTAIPRGSPVRNLPLNAETIQKQTEARAAGTPLSPEQEAKVVSYEETLKSANRIEELLSADGPDGTKGPFSDLARTGWVGQPGAGELGMELQDMSDRLLRLRSGAQINEQEYKRLRSLLPNGWDAMKELMDNPDLAKKKIAKFKAEAESILTKKRMKDGTVAGTTTQGNTNTVGRFTIEAE